MDDGVLYELVFAIGVGGLIGLLGYGFVMLVFLHDHKRGHCGWSGCQTDLRKKKIENL